MQLVAKCDRLNRMIAQPLHLWYAYHWSYFSNFPVRGR